MKNKIFSSFDEAISDIADGSTIAIFHWGLGRSTPQNLIRALYQKGIKDLTVIGHNFIPARLGNHNFPLTEVYTPLILAEQMKKVITAWPGRPWRSKEISPLEKKIATGEVELELMSHGTLAKRMSAGGSGLGGFYTQVGVDTVIEKGKEKRFIDGKAYILEKPLRADFGFVRAYKADKRGNLIYRGSTRGGNPIIAKSSNITIAEVDEIVEVGELGPDEIITPEVFVHRIVKIPEGGIGSRSCMEALFRKTLMALQAQEQAPPRYIGQTAGTKQRLSEQTIALRVAKEFSDNDYVNLGVGIPLLAALFTPEDKEVFFQTEQGALGYRRILLDNELEVADLDYVTAGGQFIDTSSLGMSFFDIDTSFDMIRGRHLDFTVLGGLEVSEHGDLANWTWGPIESNGIGGAMDLAIGAKKVIVAMMHTTKNNEPKIVNECKLPITARKCVSLVVTDLAVIEVTPHGLLLKEIAPGWTVDEVQALTEPKLILSPELKEIEL
ncbi:3-oxoacid CoA-transferase [Chloroflexota bacterium]